jgi:predicted nucleic-acid-binding protein
MLAVDTNVLVRYLTADDPAQSARARALIDGQDIYVGVTVLLEAEWVLRSGYGYATSRITEAFRVLAGSPNVSLEDTDIVAQALDWMEAGIDFADALHLLRAQNCDAFISFDRDLIRAANRVAGITVRAP